MRSPYRSLVLFGVAAVLAGCAPAGPAKLSDADLAAVKALQTDWGKNAVAADWDAFGKMFAADVVGMPPNADVTKGRDALVALGKAYPKITKFTAEQLEVTGAGDLAVARGKYSLTATPTGAPEINDTGSYVDVFRKGADGKWAYAQVIWHSDLPLPAAAPAAPAKKK